MLRIAERLRALLALQVAAIVYVENVEGMTALLQHGEQPVLDPGDGFEYTSGTPLSTASGIMSGHYVMHDAEGRSFEVEVPAFSLDCPYTSRSLN